MIAKLPKKDIFSLLYITALALVALYYGFTSIPSPTEQRKQSLDHQRVVHLGEIRYSIDEYYRRGQILPQALSDLKTNEYATYQAIITQDPETMKQYEYAVVDKQSYKLCATFTTDSTKEDKYEYDDNNYNYSSFKNEFTHPEGYFCFTFNAPETYNNDFTKDTIESILNPTPSK